MGALFDDVMFLLDNGPPAGNLQTRLVQRSEGIFGGKLLKDFLGTGP